MNIVASSIQRSGPPGSRREDESSLVFGVDVSATLKGHRGKGGGGLGPEETLVSHTLTSGGFDASEDGSGRGTPLVASVSENQRGEVLETDYAHQLTTGGGKPGQGFSAARIGSAVRRLTPTECERLQGFPDGWTIPEGPSLVGESSFPYRADERCPLPDGPRYAAMGDAVTVPVIEWIGRRIVAFRG